MGNVELAPHDNQLINQYYFPRAFVGQCGTPHCADRSALQPAALSADDVRVAF